MSSLTAQHLLDHVRTPVIALDTQLNIVQVNVAAQNLFNISQARVKNKSLSTIFLSDLQLQELIAQALKQEASIIQREVSLCLHNTHELAVDITVTPIKQALVLEFHPLDRLRRINQEINTFSTQLSSKELMRNLAHEIKNPLAGLSGAAQLLQREIAQTEYTEYTEIIISEVQRLTNLVDTLLGPNKKQTLVPINIHEVIERVLQLIKVEIDNQAETKISLVRRYDPSIPDVSADKEQLIQAVLNITKNALQVLNESKINGEILVKTSVERNYTIGNKLHRLVCRIDIEDNGPGIAKEHQETIFLPLVSHSQHGTGLGLAIAQSIISQHAGLIILQSQPGKTCFSLYLTLS